MHGGDSNDSKASGKRAERGDSRNGDDYDYNANSGDSGQWNLDYYGHSSGASDDDLPPLQVHEASTSLRDTCPRNCA